MKKFSAALAVAVAVSLVCHEADGRGGGGRGGGGFHGGGGGGFHGGGGGGFHGGGARPSVNRTPSFSSPRPQARPGGSGLSNVNRPGGGARPGAGNQIASRPNFQNRPSTGSRPSVGDRPSIGGRPGIGDRPGIAQRPGIGERPGVGGRPDIASRPGRPGDRFDHNHINHDHWHHGNWHDHWDHPWANHPWAWWGAGVATGVVASAIPWSWGYWGYENPYATAPVVVDDSTIDYSEPILAAEGLAGAPADESQPAEPTPADLASQDFDAAREAFLAQDYAKALAQVNKAIAKVPNDATLHEFRGLVLFATKQYKEAAGAIYAVLSAGPGWDWTTLSSLYSSVAVYTEQLRALEAYRKQNPGLADARFLLAYHYLTCGKTEAAAKELQAAVEINPKDQLSAQLLAGITGPTDAAEPPKAAPPAAPAKPVTAAALAGSWKAARPDGSAIALELSRDSKFAWKYTQKEKAHDFSGTYTVADNLLILNQDNNPAMVGQIAQFDGRSFNFRLPGSPAGDPGLTFSK